MKTKTESSCSPRFGTLLTILAVLASVMTVFVILQAEADDSSANTPIIGKCGDNVTFTYYTDGTLVISGTGGMYDYSETNAPWSRNGPCIHKIIIKDSITSLGEWAFRDCTNLNELTIPITLNSVKSDAHPAFAGCTNIKKVNVTYGTDGYGPRYDVYPVSDCWYENTPWYQSRHTLKELNLAEGIRGIGSDTFRDLCRLQSIVVPNSVTVAGDHCFYACNNVTELTLPISLRPFCNEKYPAFFGCLSIDKITFTRGNGTPYDYSNWSGHSCNTQETPWNYYKRIPKTIIISDDVEELGEHMFEYCCIKELTIPASLNFSKCSYSPFFELHRNYLEKVTITKGTGTSCNSGENEHKDPWHWAGHIYNLTVEEGVTNLGNYMFKYCTIDNLVLPSSLESFGNGTFYCCSIKSLTIPISLNAVWIDEHPAFDGIIGLNKVTFTPGSGHGFNYAAYADMNCWYQKTPWFQCRDYLKSIVFEEGIKSIGSDAFRELKIGSITIPNSVESLGNHSFFQCKELIRLTIPITLNSVFSDKYPAFDQCNVLIIKLTAGYTGIGWDYTGTVPPWCNNLAHNACTIIIDEGIQHIGNNTFSGLTFIASDGSTLQPTADNLCGHAFEGSTSVKTQNDGMRSLMQFAS